MNPCAWRNHTSVQSAAQCFTDSFAFSAPGMSDPTTERDSRIAQAIFLASLIIGLAVFAWYGVAAKPQASTTAVKTTVNGITTIGTSGPAPGLELRLTVNATTLRVGQSLNVGVSLFNGLSSLNSIPASHDWAFQGVPAVFWPPCYLNALVQAAVVSGNYTMQGLQSVANATIGYNCAEGGGVESLTFQPESSLANITATSTFSYGTFQAGPDNLSLNFTTGGYWDLLNFSKLLNPPFIGDQYLPNPPVATTFAPGVYTIAVEDEWGQAAILHFTVEG
jgi:hypothetical protein